MIRQLVLGDSRERIRRYSFLVTLAFMFFFGFLVISGKYSVNFGPCRGEPNSAFVGGVMATATTWMLMLIGFYVIKNSVSRDRITGVGQILAATSLGNTNYLLAKALSNALAMTVMAGVLVVAAVVMQLLGGMARELSLWQIFAPFLFITLPIILMIAATAVFFETIPALNGSVGNVVYFFLAAQFMTMPLIAESWTVDPVGIKLLISSMQTAAQAAYPDLAHGMSMGFVGLIEGGAQSHPTFRWDGIDWTLAVIVPRLGYIVAAFLIIIVAARFFDRFSGVKAKRSQRRREAISEEQIERSAAGVRLDASNLQPVHARFGFVHEVKAEFVLLVKRYNWKWHVVAGVLLVVQLAVPYQVLRQFIMPAAWIWPVGVWSSMGSRERMFNTESLVFSSAHPLLRQLPALWLAGIAVTVLAGFGGLVRALLAGDAAYLSALLMAAVFIPSMALALGTLSGGHQLFEIVYVFLWYLGPVNRIAALDFMATTGSLGALSSLIGLFLVTIVLLVTAWAARRNRLAT